MLHVLMKGIVQANIKRQKYQTSLKTVMFMSAKSYLYSTEKEMII